MSIPFIAQKDFFPDGEEFDDLELLRDYPATFNKYRYDILGGIKKSKVLPRLRIKVQELRHRNNELTVTHLIDQPDCGNWMLLAAGSTANGEDIYFWVPTYAGTPSFDPEDVIEELCAAGCIRVYCRKQFREIFANLWVYQCAIYDKSLRAAPLDDQFQSGVYYHPNIDAGSDDIKYWSKKLQGRSKSDEEYCERLRSALDDVLTGRKKTAGPRSVHARHLLMMNNIKNRKLAVIITSTYKLYWRMNIGMYPGNCINDHIDALYLAGGRSPSSPAYRIKDGLSSSAIAYWRNLDHVALTHIVGTKEPGGGWLVPIKILEQLNYQT